jgi:cysteinyl-tRNA synthetase
MLAGARVDVEPEKRDPADFALWKFAKAGEPAWESPWGRGRPGWHIECSAMAKAVLGETIDIHAGGLDLIFPHHENEIAQSECANGKTLANYWLHNGFLDMNGEKMSKSIGNVALIHDLLEDWPGEVLRMALLSGHYRAPLDFTDSLLEQSRNTLDGWYRALESLGDVEATQDRPIPTGVLAALADDLATPRAFAEISALATAANKASSPEERAQIKADLLSAGRLLGLLSADPAQWLKGDVASVDAAQVEALIAARAAARTAKNWAEADRVRAEIAALGVILEDGASGTTWRVA